MIGRFKIAATTLRHFGESRVMLLECNACELSIKKLCDGHGIKSGLDELNIIYHMVQRVSNRNNDFFIDKERLRDDSEVFCSAITAIQSLQPAISFDSVPFNKITLRLKDGTERTFESEEFLTNLYNHLLPGLKDLSRNRHIVSQHVDHAKRKVKGKKKGKVSAQQQDVDNLFIYLKANHQYLTNIQVGEFIRDFFLLAGFPLTGSDDGKNIHDKIADRTARK